MSKLCFAGSIVGEPWWTIGNVVAAVLAPEGYQVEVSSETFSHHNLEWVHADRAQIGVTTPGHFAKARARAEKYADLEVDVDALRSLAVITRPQWLALAFRRRSGISDLSAVVRDKRPIRLLGSVEPTGALYTLVQHYGFSLDELREWGGTALDWDGTEPVLRGEIDVVFGRLYAGYTPHMATWYRAVAATELDFAPFPTALIDTWVSDNSYRRATIPQGFLPGVKIDLPTAGTDQTVIYAKASIDDELVTALVRGIDENSALFLHSRTPLWYERSKVAIDLPIPLHPAAEAYYRKVGYIA